MHLSTCTSLTSRWVFNRSKPPSNEQKLRPKKLIHFIYIRHHQVRAPSVGSWVQVQRCQFSRQAEMRTNLLFSDLLVSGVVRLLPGDLPMGSPQGISPPEHCTMTLRLRRAGLELRAAPHLSGGPKIAGRGTGIQVRTESNFVDPHFLSVHAYGCKLDQWARNGWFDFPPRLVKQMDIVSYRVCFLSASN